MLIAVENRLSALHREKYRTCLGTLTY